MYPKVNCKCGRTLGSNVFRQHARKCAPMLKEWARNGHKMELLDERSDAEKQRDPIPTIWTWSMPG
jgi:hypothetical protein